MTHPAHPASGICETGRKIYVRALHSGRVAPSAIETAPCLVDSGLLRYDGDGERLVPMPPADAIERIFELTVQDMSRYRDLALSLVTAVERSGAFSAEAAAEPSIILWEGKERIDAELVRALEQCTEELLTAQPMGNRPAWVYRAGVERVRPLAQRGVRVRSLYSHTARHTPQLLDYLAQLQHTGMEVRTLDENIERTIIIDREIAFVPAQPDRAVAAEIRHRGLAWYLAAMFDRFWNIATPWTEGTDNREMPEGITGVQLKIARLLVEGHLDEAIARRLGMNVRTCRAHIARLATALGSSNRTELGYLIARSGVLDSE